MQSTDRHGRYVAILLTASLLAAACGASTVTPSASSGSDPIAAGSSTPATEPSTGAATSPDLPSFEPGAAPPPLPEPTMDEPFTIGEALYDPARMADAVVSLLGLLQVGIYSATGTPIRRGAERDADDLWLTEDEVRGLIEMGAADAGRMQADDRAAPTTPADLHAALAPLLPGLTVAEMTNAFTRAYAEHPDDPVAQVMLGQPIEPGTPLTRVQRWLLYVDGFVAPTGLAARRPLVASLGSWSAARMPLAVNQVGLPSIPSPDPRLTGPEFALLLAHLSVIGYTIPFDVEPVTAGTHEGHGGEGSPVVLRARHRPSYQPLVSPVTGIPLLLPASGGLQRLAVTWSQAGESIIRQHGRLDVMLGVPQPTDSLGITTLTFTPRKEASDGRGEVTAEVASLDASVDLRDLVTHHYDVPPTAWGFISGTRTAPGLLLIEWHGPGLKIDITNTYDVRLSVGVFGDAHGTGTDRAEGFLALGDDGTYRGLLRASVDGTFSGKGLGASCQDAFTGSQDLRVIGRPGDVADAVVLRFYPESAPVLSAGPCTKPIEFGGGGPDAQPGGRFLPLNDTRWTTPESGFVITAPTTGVTEYRIPSPPGLTGTSTWTVRVERILADP